MPLKAINMYQHLEKLVVLSCTVSNFSQIFLTIYQSARLHNLEGSNLHQHCCYSLRYHIMLKYVCTTKFLKHLASGWH